MVSTDSGWSAEMAMREWHALLSTYFPSSQSNKKSEQVLSYEDLVIEKVLSNDLSHAPCESACY